MKLICIDTSLKDVSALIMYMCMDVCVIVCMFDGISVRLSTCMYGDTKFTLFVMYV